LDSLGETEGRILKISAIFETGFFSVFLLGLLNTLFGVNFAATFCWKDLF